MRKMLACVLLCALVLSLSGCGGNAENAAVIDMTSEIYTQEDYLAAVQAVKTGFRDFQGCTLKEISYAGDETVRKEQEVHPELRGLRRGICPAVLLHRR